MTSFIFALALLVFVGTTYAHSEYLPGLLQWVEKTTKEGKQSVFNADETALKNAVSITTGGTNAEAYWSFDGKKFSFQAIRGPLGEQHPCDQIYTMNADGSNITQLSTGFGRDTCSYFYPDGINVLYSSTTLQPYCPPAPDMAFGYVWPIYHDMNVFVKNLAEGTGMALTRTTGDYNAESTISPDGKRIIFTSTRDGDLELYTMNLGGGDVRRMTFTPGYDGGAYFSFNNKMFTWRANRPRGENLTNYLNLLKLGLIEPTNMQILVQDVDLATPPRQLTFNDATNFSPFFLPDDSGVIFSSNMHNPQGGNFQMYTIDLNGNNLQQITFYGNFNSFPMFSPDGKKLAWCSDRGARTPGEINVFVADWAGPGSKLTNVQKVEN